MHIFKKIKEHITTQKKASNKPIKYNAQSPYYNSYKIEDKKNTVSKFTPFQPPKTDNLNELNQAAKEHSDKMFALHQAEIKKFNPEGLDLSSASNNQLTSVEKYFLKYLNNLSVETPNIAGYWTYEYNIDYKKTITKFINNGYIEISNNSISVCTVAELKTILKDNKLTVSGKKADLINRIIDNKIDLNKYPNAIKPIYILTEKGITETESLLPSATKNTDMEDKCLELIKKLDFNAAYINVCKFEASKNLPRGIGIDWNKEIKRGLSEDKIKKYSHFFNSNNLIPNNLKQYELEIKSCIILGIMLGATVQGIYNVFYRITACNSNKELIMPLLQKLEFDLMDQLNDWL